MRCKRNGVELLDAESAGLLVDSEGAATVWVTRCIGQFPGQLSVQQDLTLLGDQPSLDIVTTVD